MSRALIVVAYVLLGLLTVATFGGYFLVTYVLKGGESPGWPPDRPVEWATFAGVTGSVVGLLLGLGAIWLMNLTGLRKEGAGRPRTQGPDRSEP